MGGLPSTPFLDALRLTFDPHKANLTKNEEQLAKVFRTKNPQKREDALLHAAKGFFFDKEFARSGDCYRALAEVHELNGDKNAAAYTYVDSAQAYAKCDLAKAGAMYEAAERLFREQGQDRRGDDLQKKYGEAVQTAVMDGKLDVESSIVQEMLAAAGASTRDSLRELSDAYIRALLDRSKWEATGDELERRMARVLVDIDAEPPQIIAAVLLGLAGKFLACAATDGDFGPFTMADAGARHRIWLKSKARVAFLAWTEDVRAQAWDAADVSAVDLLTVAGEALGKDGRLLDRMCTLASKGYRAVAAERGLAPEARASLTAAVEDKEFVAQQQRQEAERKAHEEGLPPPAAPEPESSFADLG